MEFEQALKIIELTIIVVALFLIYNSFPAGKVKELIELLKIEAKKTETPIDDLAVNGFEMAMDLWWAKKQSQQPRVPDAPSADSGGELSPEA